MAMAIKACMLALILTLGASLGLGVFGGVSRAQVPVLPGDDTDPPVPPPPPVVDPGPLGDATTHIGGDPARRGAVAGAGLRTPLQSLWRQDFGALVSAAVVGGGRAYVHSGTRVTALDLRTGRRLWTSAAQVGSALAFGGGKLIAVGDGTVALDAATGAVVWGAQSEGGAPLIAGDLVIVQDQGLVAYDLATGTRRWRGGDTDGTGGAPAAAGDRIFQSGGCTVAAADRRSGRVLWRRNRGCSGGGSDPVALQGAKVHSSFGPLPLAAADGKDTPGPQVDIIAGATGFQTESEDGIAAVDLATGRLLWRRNSDDTFINDTLGAPLVVGDNLFQTRFEGTVEARAARTGAVNWRGRLREAEETFTGSSSASDFSQAAGDGVLVVLRGSTVDGLGSAATPPRALRIRVPRAAARATEAGARLEIGARTTGNLWPSRVIVEANRYPFRSFRRTGRTVPPDEQGRVRVSFKTDRNVRVRLVGLRGSARATRSYTVFAYPRIRIALRNTANRVRAKIRVRGSGALRFSGRSVNLYVARARSRQAIKLGSAPLRGPRTRTGRAALTFRALDVLGPSDVIFACVPHVHRLGQGAADPVQRRCGRAKIRF